MSIHTKIVVKTKNEKQAKAIRKAIENSPFGKCWEKEYKYKNDVITFKAKINDEALKKQRSFLMFKWKQRRIDTDIIKELSKQFPEVIFDMPPYEDENDVKIKHGKILER
jgi:hypothetical protein